MNNLILIVLAMIGLPGCPLRAEIEKKVIEPSPTLTKQSLIEAEFGNKYNVSCPRAVHKNLDTLTAVSFGVVLDVDHRRNKIKVIEFYPANTVAELDQKIATRIQQKEKAVIAQARAATPPPATTPAATAPAVEERELVGATGAKIPFVYDAVVGDAAKALGTIIDLRGQISALKEQVGKLTEELKNKPLTSVPSAQTPVPDAELVKANDALQQQVAELNEKLAATVVEKQKSDADQVKAILLTENKVASVHTRRLFGTVCGFSALIVVLLLIQRSRHKKPKSEGEGYSKSITPPLPRSLKTIGLSMKELRSQSSNREVVASAATLTDRPPEAEPPVVAEHEDPSASKEEETDCKLPDDDGSDMTIVGPRAEEGSTGELTPNPASSTLAPNGKQPPPRIDKLKSDPAAVRPLPLPITEIEQSEILKVEELVEKPEEESEAPPSPAP